MIRTFYTISFCLVIYFSFENEAIGQESEIKNSWPPTLHIPFNESDETDSNLYKGQTTDNRFYSDLLASKYSIELNGINTQDGRKYYIGLQDRDDTGSVHMPLAYGNTKSDFPVLKIPQCRMEQSQTFDRFKLNKLDISK